MKKIGTVVLAALLIIFFHGISLVSAQDEAKTETPAPIGVKVTGTNYGLLQTLAPKELATASSAYAKLNALKVLDAATADGTALPELAGKTLYYLPTQNAQPLFVGGQHQDHKVTVIGRLFMNERALLVEELESEAGADEEWETLPTGKRSGIQDLSE